MGKRNKERISDIWKGNRRKGEGKDNYLRHREKERGRRKGRERLFCQQLQVSEEIWL
jgi:hypothetical protein